MSKSKCAILSSLSSLGYAPISNFPTLPHPGGSRGERGHRNLKYWNKSVGLKKNSFGSLNFYANSEFDYTYLVKVPEGTYTPIEFVATVGATSEAFLEASLDASKEASTDASNEASLIVSLSAAVKAANQAIYMNPSTPQEYEMYYNIYYDECYDYFYCNYFDRLYEELYCVYFYEYFDMYFDVYFEIDYEELYEDIERGKEYYGIEITSDATIFVTHPTNPECLIQIDTVTTNDIPIEEYDIVIPKGTLISSTVYTDGSRETTYSIDGNLVATLSTEEGTITFADGTVIAIDPDFTPFSVVFLGNSA